jgi:hypothetical protein
MVTKDGDVELREHDEHKVPWPYCTKCQKWVSKSASGESVTIKNKMQKQMTPISGGVSIPMARVWEGACHDVSYRLGDVDLVA